MTRKFFSVLMIMFIVLVSFTNIYAADGLFHIGTYEDIYKLSEQVDIDLPFLNMFLNTATYDKNVKHSGISFGSTTINVNEKLEGMHAILSTDMVTIKGEVENSFIYANNVVIEGKLSSDSIIIAPNVKIKENAVIEKDVIIIGNNLEISGTVKGNVIATITEKTTISGKINEDLRIMTSDLVFNNEEITGEIYVETNADTTDLKTRYPNAIVKGLVDDAEPKTDWMAVITKGIITIAIYTLIAFVVTRKENNVVERACKKFKTHTAFALIISVIALMLVLILPLLLIVLATIGLGVVAWPMLIAYVALLLLVGTTAMLIVGMAIYDSIKDKVAKYKIAAIALIYALLYALTQITLISTYANVAMILIALGIVITMLIKKLPQDSNQV